MTDASPSTKKKPFLGGILKKGPGRIVLGVVGLLIVTPLLMGVFKSEKPSEYRTEAIRKTTVTRGVSASGALEAVDSVTIGSEISGQVVNVLVDFNDVVKKGQLLAVIDTETYVNRVRQAQAQLDSAAADTRVADADYDRQKRLADAGLVATKTMQDAGAQRERSRAALRQAQAALSTANNDLSKANIRSPIDGVVVNRTIERGQTVAASLNAPELFVIAKDLSRMQIKVMVDEADIGEVKEGQMVRFTVDAFPDDNFEGRVTQVRKQPESTANVVTYVVIAEAANPQRKLLPGMTANADIVIEEHPDVLAAPAAGLRWKPADAKDDETKAGGAGPQVASNTGGGFGGGQGGGFGGGMRAPVSVDDNPLFKDLKLDAKQKAAITSIEEAQRAKRMSAMPGADGDRAKMRAQFQKLRAETNEQIAALLRPDQKATFLARAAEAQARFGNGQGGQRAAMQRRQLYLLVDKKPKAVSVMAGANDGTIVEVRGEGIKEGDLVITGEVGAKAPSLSGQRGGNGGRGGPMPFGAP